MLPKINRLKISKNKQLSDKLIIRGKHTLVWIESSQDKKPPQFTIVVGKNVYNQAVKRNRLRRKIQGILITHLTFAKPGNKIMIKLTTSAGKVSYVEAAKDVCEALNKASVFRGRKL